MVLYRFLFPRSQRQVPVEAVAERTPAPMAREVRSHRFDRRALSLFAVASILMAVAGYAIWPGFSYLEPRGTLTGGLLLLHDPSFYGPDGDGQRAEIDAEMWETGVPGVTAMRLTIRFDSPASEDRWYVVASGDYAVKRHLDPFMYCLYGDGVEEEERIVCSAQAGNPAIELRFDQELGGAIGVAEVSRSVEEIDGYDRRLVTVLSGAMPPDRGNGIYEVELMIPIATPPRQIVGGDEFLAFAPVAARDQMWSSGPDLDKPCRLETGSHPAALAFTQTCETVTSVTSTVTMIDPGIEVGVRTVEYASPDTDSDDVVRWTMAGGFPGAQALVTDPFAQADESRRAFAAALVLSGAVSFGLLFVERLVFHRGGRRGSQGRD